MIEIGLNLQTIYVGGLTINDMINKFGKRIRKAIVYEDEKPHGLSSVKMVKLMRWWKFWNKDIKKAYNKYTGLQYVPWTIEYGEPKSYYSDSINWDEMTKMLEEEISQGDMKKYTDKPVDPKFYLPIRINKMWKNNTTENEND